MAKNPKNITIYGYYSFPKETYKEAVEWNQKSDYPKPDVSKIAPEFHILVEKPQLEKLVKHLKDEYLPFVAQRHKAGETRDALDPAQVQRLEKWLDAEDWGAQPPYMPIKLVHDKTAEMVPEAMASIKVLGIPGKDLILKAIVNSEDELAVPDPDLLQFPVIKNLSETVHDMSAGCIVAATLNLYSFVSGKLPGISASASTVVFKSEGVAFGGGTDVDEDEIFID